MCLGATDYGFCDRSGHILCLLGSLESNRFPLFDNVSCILVRVSSCAETTSQFFLIGHRHRFYHSINEYVNEE